MIMDPIAAKALKLLREIKSITFATVNKSLPAARIIDVMLVKKDGLYFLTARGKSFYAQLKAEPKIAICGMDQNYVTARIIGDINFCNNRGIIDEIFEHNPMMNDLYPGEKRDILEGFHLYRGKGEIFDLSTEPPGRERFAFGGETVNPPGYTITNQCTACSLCVEACPVEAISEDEIYRIDGSHCLECGRCAEICPEDAIETAKEI
ncbi:MAG: 4Fe-4S binding protein [Deltaproteobacteria bacterium]|nr:4Fe-4S binding protein [Deltaproteobacteria bacterium]